MSPAHAQLMEEFGVDDTQAILPLSLYVFALAFGPIVGSPLSETVGRLPVYLIGTPLGTLFTLGAGFTHSFVGLCILRFLAGLAFSPSLTIASGVINEMLHPVDRAVPSAIFILMPFLGPGLGWVSPSINSIFVANLQFIVPSLDPSLPIAKIGAGHSGR
jgi:MFS family permease